MLTRLTGRKEFEQLVNAVNNVNDNSQLNSNPSPNIFNQNKLNPVVTNLASTTNALSSTANTPLQQLLTIPSFFTNKLDFY